jgi:hypothetical protein
MGGVTDVIGRSGSPALVRAAADHRSAVARRRQAVQERLRVQRKVEQNVIDREVRATRHALVRAVRRRWTADVRTLLDDDFLTVADRPTVYEAIVDAAVLVGGARGADLQVYDPDPGVLRMAAQRGFSPEFLDYFATVDTTGRTACAQALATREPVLVDNVSRSPIFVGQASLEPMLDAGSRSVQSYPVLAAGGEVLGVLSFHHRTSAPRSSRTEAVVCCAAQALAVR